MPPRPPLYRRPSTPADRQGLCPPDKVEAYCTYLEVMNRQTQWSLGHPESRESLTLPYHDEIHAATDSTVAAASADHHQTDNDDHPSSHLETKYLKLPYK
ncbi:hypothetical protein PENFLA_c064G04607 [Penicillium flavigenum]|uniref:Uncharacterized protein n=1 Tax=Penicillium flavigenum TaxID=254877 RepID=A0A1V6SGB1_9EURO|nr:hypothetical protein PENFLA_c064G04607 [Penicillium flavigenum]